LIHAQCVRLLSIEAAFQNRIGLHTADNWLHPELAADASLSAAKDFCKVAEVFSPRSHLCKLPDSRSRAGLSNIGAEGQHETERGRFDRSGLRQGRFLASVGSTNACKLVG
jgi:hypothetical protein